MRPRFRNLPIAALVLVFLVTFSLAQNPGPVTGVIDALQLEGDQYYVHGWACQEGQRDSIDVHVYAGNVAGGIRRGHSF